MKTLKALLIVTLMSASVAAMAEGGGDTVTAKMEAARESAMATYQQSEHSTAVASNQKAPSNDVECTN
ncbi:MULTISPECIES: co-regulatory protein PtrA N-terminal domain-containing protein [Pseudomonas]|uniref:co-regulatory protein PtrA N-terminal domain-containing protein n=1 Tax=unclassified Pseudomonas TaxID=196821 RepID=UPI0021181076|nr:MULTISPECIES: co-regulatory protein PtrA N-terminal domain-containing protein [unclassified Pseudomonas]